jgi:hypothetical protein
MVFFSLFFLFFCPPISLMDLATWRRSCHGIADRMVAPRPGPLASHRPQAQLVADASPPAIPWARLAHYWSACCFWNPPSHPPGTQPLPRSSFAPAVVPPFLPILGEICCFATLKFGCLLLCHPVSMTGGTICVYDLWVRWHNGEAHK